MSVHALQVSQNCFQDMTALPMLLTEHRVAPEQATFIVRGSIFSRFPEPLRFDYPQLGSLSRLCISTSGHLRMAFPACMQLTHLTLRGGVLALCFEDPGRFAARLRDLLLGCDRQGASKADLRAAVRPLEGHLAAHRQHCWASIRTGADSL